MAVERAIQQIEPQQEDKKILPLWKVYKKTYWEWDGDILADKIDEIINHINERD